MRISQGYYSAGTRNLYDWMFLVGPTLATDAQRRLKIATHAPNGGLAMECHGDTGKEELVIALAGVRVAPAQTVQVLVSVMNTEKTYKATSLGDLGGQVKSALLFSSRDSFRILDQLAAAPASFAGTDGHLSFAVGGRVLKLRLPTNMDILRVSSTVCARWNNRVVTGDELTPLQRQELDLQSHGLSQSE